jgi:heterodisulfide reductase subunit A
MDDGSAPRAVDENQQADADNEEPRIGVYTCYCGGNISDAVDCKLVARTLARLPNVVVSRTNMSMCSDSGQSIIEQDIKELGVNRVVIGACAPSLHEATFRQTVERAGLNRYYYHHVGLREQDSWVHGHDRILATEKAIRLMAAGIAKARLLEPLEAIRLPAEKHALVIGGGVAGLKAALAIARRDMRVTLIEKTPFLGGRMAQLERIFPSGEHARTVLGGLIHEVADHPRITIHVGTQLTSISGYVGDFKIQLTKQSRGVTPEQAEQLMDCCSQYVPDEFNYGLTQRKVIYRPYDGCYPSLPAVDWEHYDGSPITCGSERIVLKNDPETLDLSAGAVVVATGFNPYEPAAGEYGYGVIPEVITLPQLIRKLALLEAGASLEINGHPVRDIVMLHCVGSRQIEGVHEPQPDGQVNDYCSRVCCTATMYECIELKERFPEINLFDVHEDIRTYGRGHEEFYRQTLEDGTVMLRYQGENPPVVEALPSGDSHPLVVRLRDRLTWGEEVEVPADLVVLAVGMMPRLVNDLVEMLKISPGKDRFLLEVHPKLRPVETSVSGVVLAGTAQGPMSIQESAAAAEAAAAKVACLLSQGRVELEPFVARVNPELCEGTGACVEVCAYENAISLRTIRQNGSEKRHAVVSPANCSGCGNCVSACPHGAIDVQGWTLKQFDAMVDGLAIDMFDVLEVEK